MPGSTMMHSEPFSEANTQQFVANIGAGWTRISISHPPSSDFSRSIFEAVVRQGTFVLPPSLALTKALLPTR